MTKPFRKTLIIMGLATGAVIILPISMRTHEGQTERKLAATSNLEPPDGVAILLSDDVANPAGSKDETSAPRTKPRIRPSSEELTRRRLERHRIEIVEGLNRMREAGFGDKHPSILAASENLKKIEAEQAEAPNRR
ncbi:MAG: hypothetical protein V4819_25040 [Verrucomicrobiota bacterium]